MKIFERSRTRLPILSAFAILGGLMLLVPPAQALQIPAGAAADFDGNDNAVSDELSIADGIKPTVASDDAPANYTGAGTIEIIVTFDEPVKVNSGTIIISGATGTMSTTALTSVTGATLDTQWKTTLTIGTDVGGDITLSLDDGAVQDDAGNSIVAEDIATITDSMAPTVTAFTAEADEYTANQDFTFTVTFSEPITGITTNDFTATNGTVDAVSSSNSNKTWTITVTPDGTGRLDLEINASAIVDGGGNDVPAKVYSTDFNNGVQIPSDGPAPTVTVASKSGATSYTDTGDQTFTVTFSEGVSGFEAGDVTIVSGGVANTVVITSGTDNDAVYEFTVTPVGTGPLSLNIPADAVNDLGANGVSLVNLSVTDGIAPTATYTVPSNYTGAGNLTVDVTFDERVSLVSGGVGAVTTTNTNAGITIGALTADPNDNTGTKWQVVITLAAGVSGDIPLTLTAGAVQDTATPNPNTNAEASMGTIEDGVAPTVAGVASSATSYTDQTAFDVTVTFSEWVDSSTVTGAFTITVGTIDTVQTSDNIVYTLTITPPADLAGDIDLGLTGDVVADVSDNKVAAVGSFDSAIANWSAIEDKAGPTGEMVAEHNPYTTKNAQQLTITFSEPIDPATFVVGDITVTGGTLGSSLSTSDNKTWTIDLTPLGTGTIDLNIPADCTQCTGQPE
ncbi:Ig-like domain-containing protein [Nitratireductor sp. XY-223]|uniref:beta strand repeat-containing protein n=1 Tax=Nitratireductor sp. XY-223 TaxID=2561926 RepID=UPI0010AB4494|nr:Ig-like domain-containing protein [Nitratireductor sp. XY-223]